MNWTKFNVSSQCPSEFVLLMDLPPCAMDFVFGYFWFLCFCRGKEVRRRITQRNRDQVKHEKRRRDVLKQERYLDDGVQNKERKTRIQQDKFMTSVVHIWTLLFVKTEQYQ